LKEEDLEYKKYDSEELLVVLSLAEDEPEEAKVAFFELFNRYSKELVRYCVTMCNTEANPNKFSVVFDPGDAEEIVWNSFYQLKNSPENFDLSKATTKDKNKAVEAYLKGIVRTEFKKKYFGVEKLEVDYNYEVDLSIDGQLLPTRKILKEMSAEIEDALRSLPVKEREVFLAKVEFCPNGEYLPREIGSLLRDKLELPGESSLRVYYQRAKTKLQLKLER
jgi:DNA-directed RNA polymerase specialized sigma24 family protein